MWLLGTSEGEEIQLSCRIDSRYTFILKQYSLAILLTDIYHVDWSPAEATQKYLDWKLHNLFNPARTSPSESHFGDNLKHAFLCICKPFLSNPQFPPPSVTSTAKAYLT